MEERRISIRERIQRFLFPEENISRELENVQVKLREIADDERVDVETRLDALRELARLKILQVKPDSPLRYDELDQ